MSDTSTTVLTRNKQNLITEPKALSHKEFDRNGNNNNYSTVLTESNQRKLDDRMRHYSRVLEWTDKMLQQELNKTIRFSVLYFLYICDLKEKKLLERTKKAVSLSLREVYKKSMRDGSIRILNKQGIVFKGLGLSNNGKVKVLELLREHNIVLDRSAENRMFENLDNGGSLPIEENLHVREKEYHR